MNAQARLGAFVIVALIAFAMVSGKIGNVVWFKQEAHLVETEFADLLGLEVQSQVRMAGVRIGKVQEIVLKGNRALVRVALHPGVQLPGSTRAAIVTRGLVGEKYLSFYAQDGDETRLAEGARIPSDERGDINAFISEVGGVAQELKALTIKLQDAVSGGKDEVGLDELLTSTDRAFKEITDLISDSSPALKHAAGNINLASESLAGELPAAMRQLRETLRHADLVILDNRENMFHTMFQLRVAAENLAVLTDDLKRNPWKLMNKQKEVPLSKQRADGEARLLEGAPIPPAAPTR